MKKSLWVMAAFAVAVILFLALVSQKMVVDVAGVEEAKELQGTLRGAYAVYLAEEPPLRVWRVPPSEGRGFSWRVEATLKPGMDPSSPDTKRRLVDRILSRCEATTVLGRPPAKVRLILRGSDGSTATHESEVKAAPPPAPPPGAPGR